MSKLVAAARKVSWEESFDRIVGPAFQKLNSERDAAVAQRNAAIAERDAAQAERDTARAERDQLAAEVAMHRSFDAEHDANCDLLADLYWRLDQAGFGG